eukprot:6217145-Prymnesium_polylepis.1
MRNEKCGLQRLIEGFCVQVIATFVLHARRIHVLGDCAFQSRNAQPAQPHHPLSAPARSGCAWHPADRGGGRRYAGSREGRARAGGAAARACAR